jgi:hypothetical protein
MKLADLVDAVPADVEERVDKTRQRFNGLVRAILREEMALRLSMPSIDSDRSAKLETTTVPVRLKAGVPLVDNSPVEVKNVEVIDIVLGRHRSGLEALASGAAASSRLVDVLEASGVAAPGSYPSHELQICERWARTFLERLKEADPLTHILDFREDILGRYLYRLPQFIQPLNQWTKDPYPRGGRAVLGRHRSCRGTARLDARGPGGCHPVARTGACVHSYRGRHRWLAVGVNGLQKQRRRIEGRACPVLHPACLHSPPGSVPRSSSGL